MGDEQQSATLVAQAASYRKKTLYLDIGQRSRGLVHDQNLGVERDGLGNLDDLLICDRQSSAGRSGSILTPSPAIRSLTSLRIALRIDPAESPDWLSPHEDVLGHRQVGEQGGFLVDDRDTRRLGLRGRPEVDRLAFQFEGP